MGKRKFNNWLLKPIQKWKTHKTEGNFTIFGGCWAVPKYGHFCQKCPSLRAQKWHFGCPNKNDDAVDDGDDAVDDAVNDGDDAVDEGGDD